MRIGAELGQCIRSANSQCKKILKIPFGEIVTPSGYVIGGEGKGEDGRLGYMEVGGKNGSAG